MEKTVIAVAALLYVVHCSPMVLVTQQPLNRVERNAFGSEEHHNITGGSFPQQNLQNRPVYQPPKLECWLHQHGTSLNTVSCGGACTYEIYDGSKQPEAKCVQSITEVNILKFKQRGEAFCWPNFVPHSGHALKKLCFCFEDKCNEVSYFTERHLMENDELPSRPNGAGPVSVFYSMVLVIACILV